jgi:DNA-binding protein HU-beta
MNPTRIDGKIKGETIMNKMELVKAMASHSGLTQTDSEKALKAFEEVVMEELKVGGDIKLTGFMTLSVVETKARTAYNPKDRSIEIPVPAGKKVKAKIGKTLKDAVK